MFKTQIKFQRILCLVALICAALTFVYALGIMTDVYNLYGPLGLPVPEVKGASLYSDMQPFNKSLIAVSIAFILVAVVLFITNTHTRRKYYIGNYVAVGLYAAASLATTVWAYINISTFRAQYLQVDFVALKQWAELWKQSYSDSTFWFDIGYVIFGLTIVTSALLVFNLFWKASLVKQEKALIEAGKTENQG